MPFPHTIGIHIGADSNTNPILLMPQPVSYPIPPEATQRATQLISIESPPISLYSLIYVNGKYFN